MITIEQSIRSCRQCTSLKPRQLKRRLRKRPDWDPIVWHISNGHEVIACRMHEGVLIKIGGWDGTGDKQ